MLKKLFLISLLSFSIQSFGQNLNYLDLTFILNNDIELSDSYLTEKGYEFHETEKGKNGDCDAMFWSFNRDFENNTAFSFIAKNCFEAKAGFVWYQFDDKQTFNKIKSYCKSHGFKFIKTETNPFGDLCSTYKSSKYSIEFCSGIDKETNRNSYTITLKIVK